MSAQSFVDPYNYSPYSGTFEFKTYPTQEEADAAFGKEYVSSGSSIGDKIKDLFGISDTKARYENWQAERDRDYERAATLSARAWDEWMDSTAVQRRVADLKAAGLNPWLAIQSGLNAGSSVQSAGSGSSARSKTQKKESNLSGVAMLLMAAAKLISVLG